MADRDRRIRWLRRAVGVALILHALGHASAVVDAGTAIGALNNIDTADRAETSLRLASLLSAAAMSCLLAAGLGALNVRVFDRRWMVLATSGLLSSLVFLLLFQPTTMMAGAGVGAVLLYLIYRAMHRHLFDQAPRDATVSLARRAVRIAWVLALAGMALSIALRPMFLRWNTRPREAYFDLPGDTRAPGSGFQILHAVNIEATPEQVWPWLAQIGHDRGGFYSYAWLENLFGLNIVNAERINPEWQSRAIGELLPSTPENWLGLVDRPLGWRVTRFEPGRLLYLEDWGAFALVRTGPASTRMYIRTQGDATPASLWLSPLELLVFEPIHFVMQRKMLMGIKERSERYAREQRAAQAAVFSVSTQLSQNTPTSAAASTPRSQSDSARLVARGQRLFNSKPCARCHTIGRGYKDGPDLAGVTERRSEKQIMALLTDTEEAIQTDPDFQQLRIEHFLDMPNLNLSRTDALALFYYLRAAPTGRPR